MKRCVVVVIALLLAVFCGYSKDVEAVEAVEVKGNMEQQESFLEPEPTNFLRFIKSNWFVSLGIGKAWKVGDIEGLNLTSTPIYELSVGKWILPYIAFRVQFNSSAIRGTSTYSNSFSIGDVDGTLSGNRLVYHGDVMFSVMNIIDGYYKEDRFYDICPFIGLGFVKCYDEDTNYSKDNPIFGFVNNFRVTNSLDLNLEFRCSPANAGHYGMVSDAMQRQRVTPLSVSLAVCYNFKPRGWKVIAPYADYPTLKVFERNYYIPERTKYVVEKEVVYVRDTVEVSKVVSDGSIPPSIIFFEVDKYNIERRDRVRLGYVANLINGAPSNKIFTITGFADEQTATKEHNWELSKNRAEAVYYILVNEFGVDKRKLRIDYHGGVDYMYYNDNTLSRCVIIE